MQNVGSAKGPILHFQFNNLEIIDLIVELQRK